MTSTATLKAPQPSVVTSHLAIDQHQKFRKNYGKQNIFGKFDAGHPFLQNVR